MMNNLVPGRSAWMLLAGFAALALILVTLLAACGGDAVPGEDAATEAPATEATDRVRAPAPGSPATDRESLVTLYNPHFPYQPCRACRNQQRNYPM